MAQTPELSLAQDTFDKLKKLLVQSEKLFTAQTKRLLDQLYELSATDCANNTLPLISLLEKYIQDCDGYQEVKEAVSPLLQDLYRLDGNVKEYNIDIQCALDGDLLNRTCQLLNLLNQFSSQYNHHPKQTFLSYPAPKKSSQVSAGFHATTTKPPPEEVNLVYTLESVCRETRSQIGSEETKPKGLMIHLVTNLYGAINGYPNGQHILVQTITAEINQIQSLYPELVKAGEQLQNAIANHQSLKR